MTWCTYLQSFEKIQQCVFELQCKKLNVTDRQMDGGGGHFNISRPRPIETSHSWNCFSKYPLDAIVDVEKSL